VVAMVYIWEVACVFIVNSRFGGRGGGRGCGFFGFGGGCKVTLEDGLLRS